MPERLPPAHPRRGRPAALVAARVLRRFAMNVVYVVDDTLACGLIPNANFKVSFQFRDTPEPAVGLGRGLIILPRLLLGRRFDWRAGRRHPAREHHLPDVIHRLLGLGAQWSTEYLLGIEELIGQLEIRGASLHRLLALVDQVLRRGDDGGVPHEDLLLGFVVELRVGEDLSHVLHPGFRGVVAPRAPQVFHNRGEVHRPIHKLPVIRHNLLGDGHVERVAVAIAL
mmetsp:Transcript_9096/g.41180  ORF Transcript_9096/g.41180 Transcript_9096/m.41180 type:complete len:226 (-) Transcript_9096:432-1109(-)